ncbi:MAG: serine--tRNA ligase [Pseudomonadales bacterium]|nr:serine--tRNA ligase [Pseudomonadales bacterium]
MLDIRFLRNNLDEVGERLAVKGFSFDRSKFETLDAERKRADIETQSLQAERKQAAKKIGAMVQQGIPVDEAKADVNASLKKIDQSLDVLKQKAHDADAAMQAFLLGLPNLPDADVPTGTDESDNREVLRWGEIPQFDFQVQDHVDIGEQLAGLDFARAAAITGARFAVLQGPVARLHRALAQFMLDQHTQVHGYTEVNVPLIVNSSSLTGTGQLPKFAEDLFALQGDNDFFLVPTAEVPVTNLVREQIIDAGQLPLRFVAHTACFRSEAGSHGRDTRGLIRQHQFEKVELVQIVRPQDSGQALEELTGHAEAILQQLGLAYRKVILCGGDLGFGSRKTYDLEVWLPGQDTYREISSCSNFGDFQARRMQARWRNPETQKPESLHTVNGSGLAVGRTLVALLENYQRADGSVAVPQALQPYMGGADSLPAANS